MRQTITRLLCLCLLAAPTLARASGLPVVDVGAIAQAAVQYKQDLLGYAKQLEQYRQQVEAYKRQGEQLYYDYQSVVQGAKNLASLDIRKAESLLGALGQVQDQLYSKLGQIDSLGYRASQVWSQAQGLYPRIQGVLDGDQQRALRLQWSEVKRESARISLETQAIKETQGQVRQQWQRVLGYAQSAEGNVQVQQVGIQAQGLLGVQLQAIEQQLATQAREQSQRALEEAATVEMEQAAITRAMQPLNLDYTPRGRLIPLPRTGRE